MGSSLRCWESTRFLNHERSLFLFHIPIDTHPVLYTMSFDEPDSLSVSRSLCLSTAPKAAHRAVMPLGAPSPRLPRLSRFHLQLGNRPSHLSEERQMGQPS